TSASRAGSASSSCRTARPAELHRADAALTPGPLALAEYELLHLSRRRLRERPELDRVRALEVRELVAAEGDQLLLGGLCPLVQGDERLRALTPELVRDADDGALEDGGVCDERLLDLDARDLLAAGLDDVLPPVAQLDVAVGMPDGQVTGVEPAPAEGRDRRPLVVEVAAHDVVPAHDHLAHRLAVERNVVQLVVDHADQVRGDVRLTLAREQVGPLLGGEGA